MEFDITGKISPSVMFSKKCQTLFSVEKMKCHLLKFLPSRLSIKSMPAFGENNWHFSHCKT